MCFNCLKSKKFIKPIYKPLYLYYCNRCKQYFNSYKAYNKHMKKYHNI